MLARIARPSALSLRSFSVYAPASFPDPKGNAFNDREAAAENQYIREHEKEALKKLRAKLAQQQQEIQNTQDKIEEVTKKQEK